MSHCLSKYEEKCQEKHKQAQRDFVPFVVSIDGRLAPEEVNTLKCIASSSMKNGFGPVLYLATSSHESLSLLSGPPTSGSMAAMSRTTNTMIINAFGMKKVSTISTISTSN